MKFVFDIDGTISFNGQKIEKPIVRAINSISNNGKNAIFASARPIRDLLPLVRGF
ncbi:hypothetical protein LFYK43_11450 [Ligilactobacillus salitolerans]|uniref:Haloacid dehalogenase n=1 Tax=Ligilactobacillus salitolerans TaxID=1808352 RepID=A0A401IT32_9LACO|nr:hypothetical protein LFYK43_11450 [Ligilactobacillus salitolerans]